MNYSANIPSFESSNSTSAYFIEKGERLYTEIVVKKRGKIIFIAGDYGSGKSEIILTLDKYFRNLTSAETLALSFAKGSYQTISSIPNAAPIEIKGSFEDQISLLTTQLSVQSREFLSFSEQFLPKKSSDAQSESSQIATSPEILETSIWFFEVVRQIARKKPLVCLIDDFDQVNDRYG